MLQEIESLLKSLESGSYNAAPSSLTQGAALQREDLSPVMELATFEDKHLKLQKAIQSKDVKSTLHQYNRQLDYGIFGGSAQYEKGVGEEDTSNVVRVVVPMAYYSTTRRTGIAANMVEAFDGVKAEDRQETDVALKLMADIEFDIFRGQADYSNAGVFDGNPAAMADMPNMQGVDAQVRMSDSLANTQDLMFAEYGSNQSVILSVSGNLTQSVIEDSAVRSVMNQGAADALYLDPIALAQYNKIAHAKERIVLAGSAQDATGANLRTQWTTSANVALEPSRFLSGKTAPARARSGSPAQPATASAVASGSGANIPAGNYIYYATACNVRGESVKSPDATVTVTAGQQVALTIAAVTGAQYFNVYRTSAGATSSRTAKHIGKVRASGTGSTIFTDLGNRTPGSVTGYLVQKSTMYAPTLANFQSLSLAVTDLSLPRAFFIFKTLAVRAPRKNILLENITGQLAS